MSSVTPTFFNHCSATGSGRLPNSLSYSFLTSRNPSFCFRQLFFLPPASAVSPVVSLHRRPNFSSVPPPLIPATLAASSEILNILSRGITTFPNALHSLRRYTNISCIGAARLLAPTFSTAVISSSSLSSLPSGAPSSHLSHIVTTRSLVACGSLNLCASSAEARLLPKGPSFSIDPLPPSLSRALANRGTCVESVFSVDFDG
mmetsp:Transcript_27235/g.54451  ORF Transcript_27235/g.54451 Transcript_27235/m.54451 type:complete len:203 (-) Transcript_27235:7-615(-)